MSQEKDIEAKVKKYISNKFNYEDNSEALQEEKNSELDSITNYETGKDIKETRPYPNVIEHSEILEQSINIKEVSGTKALADIKVTRRLYPVSEDGNMITNTQVIDEPLELNLQENGWIVIDYDTDTLSLDRNDEQDDEDDNNQYVYTVGELISKYIKDNLVKMSNLTYQHKGSPKENPLDDKDTEYGIDMYNLYYWLLEEVGGYNDLDYPVNKYDFETTDTFVVIRDKGHKYESDLFDLDEGDIMFFGSNSSAIGIYLGEGQIVTIIGNFPRDNTNPRIYTLKDDWWNQYNGMVYRLREDVE